jgi:hypothetical protein
VKGGMAGRLLLIVLLAAVALPASAGADDALVIPVSALRPLGLQAQPVSASVARGDLGGGLTPAQQAAVARAQVQTAGARGESMQLRSEAFVFSTPGAGARILAAWRARHHAGVVAVGPGSGLLASKTGGGRVRLTVAFADGARLGLVVLTVTGSPSAARAAALEYASLAASLLPTPLATSAWERLLEQVRPDGSVSEQTALSAFALAYGPLPGVRPPPGPAGDALTGDVAAEWMLAYLPQLRGALADAVRAKLGLSGTGHAARAASFGDPGFKVSAGLTEQAQHWASEYASPTNLDHQLKLKIVAGTSPNVSASALAETLPVTANGTFSPAGPYCRIAVRPATATGPVEVLDVVLAHEVFHCEQADLSPGTFDAGHAWIIEGLAQWAADDVTQLNPSILDWMSGYVETPSIPLFTRAYTAVGFWGHVQDQTLELWQRIPAILRAALSNTAAFSAATSNSPELMSTWGSSFFRDSSAGPAWEITSPIANFPETAPVHVISSSSAVAAQPYATSQYVIAVEPASPILKIAISGTSRLSESQNIEDPAGYFCTVSDCSDICPLGSTLSVATTPLDPEHTELALTGGPGGTAGTVTYLPLSSVCQPSSSAGTPSSGGPPGAGGAGDYTFTNCGSVVGAHLVIAPSVEGSLEVATSQYELGIEILPGSSLTCAYAAQWIPALTADPPSKTLAGGPPGYLCNGEEAIGQEPTAGKGDCALISSGGGLASSIFLWVPYTPP